MQKFKYLIIVEKRIRKNKNKTVDFSFKSFLTLQWGSQMHFG